MIHKKVISQHYKLTKMKLLSTLFFVYIITTSSYAQTEKQVPSTITQVTVFRAQAQIKRTATFEGNMGVYNLVFDKLSPFINMNSIEVKVDASLTLLSVSSRNQYLNKQEKPAPIVLLDDSLETINYHLAELAGKKEAYQTEKDVLNSNKNLGGTQNGIKADELEDALMVFRKQMLELNRELIQLSIEEKKLNNSKQKIEQQLAEYNAGQMQLSNEIIVSVKANNDVQNAKIELSYLVTNVGWQPFYDIRVKDTKQPLQIMCKAKVTQSTGENWKNVMLKLTTANPAEGGIKPELQTNWLKYYEPVLLEQRNISMEKNYNAPRQAEGMQNNDMVVASNGIATFAETDINTEFVVNTPYTIPSDNAAHSVDLTVLNLKAEYQYQAVPKLDKDAFVTAKVVANDIINNLQGEANVYFDGTYTGSTYINSTANDTLSISLGRDKRIQIERKKLKEFSSKSFFGGSKTESNTWEITIKNSRKEPIKILIEDQVPVSTNKEIEVKITNTGNAKIDEPTGKLQWIFNIEAEQLQTAKFSFDVKYPSNNKLSAY